MPMVCSSVNPVRFIARPQVGSALIDVGGKIPGRVTLRQPEAVDDPLTEIARDGARRMLTAARRAEVDAFGDHHSKEVLPDGRQRVVRHGYEPERCIRTGIGVLHMRRPKVRESRT